MEITWLQPSSINTPHICRQPSKHTILMQQSDKTDVMMYNITSQCRVAQDITILEACYCLLSFHLSALLNHILNWIQRQWILLNHLLTFLTDSTESLQVQNAVKLKTSTLEDTHTHSFSITKCPSTPIISHTPLHGLQNVAICVLCMPCRERKVPYPYLAPQSSGPWKGREPDVGMEPSLQGHKTHSQYCTKMHSWFLILYLKHLYIILSHWKMINCVKQASSSMPQYAQMSLSSHCDTSQSPQVNPLF